MKNTIIHEFMYCESIHESSYCTMSLHRTKEGAEKAMNKHKEKCRKKFLKDRIAMDKYTMKDPTLTEKEKTMLIEHTHGHTFGEFEDWSVGESVLLD